MSMAILNRNIKTIMALTAIILVLYSVQGKAQKAVASLDTTSIRLGEQVQLKLDVTLPKAAKVIWPVFTDTIFSPVEIIKSGRVDTIETSRNNYLQYKQYLTITSFDSGYKTIPPITFEYQIPGDTSKQKVITDSLLLLVRTVEVDTTRMIKDIKAPMSAPLTLEELWPIFAGIAIIGLIAGFIWYYLWRKKMRKPLFPVIRKPQLPPWQTALESLNALETKKLWQNGRIKEFYTELTDVLRLYLENQHSIPAMEMISSDIIESLEKIDSLKNSKDRIWQILQLADLVKFAKENPLPSENDMSLANARNFVMETKPIEINESASPEKIEKPVAHTE
jgi:hypothetical protein